MGAIFNSIRNRKRIPNFNKHPNVIFDDRSVCPLDKYNYNSKLIGTEKKFIHPVYFSQRGATFS